ATPIRCASSSSGTVRRAASSTTSPTDHPLVLSRSAQPGRARSARLSAMSVERPVDLRSDTVTRPTPAMREAMARAEVGDDVYGEAPTVNRLQERVAELLGKEAALFVPSGTMANQIALHLHTRPGDEVIVGAGAHCMAFESGAGAALSGVQFQVLGAS